MRNPRYGTMLDLADATHVRDGIPLCGSKCVIEYERQKASETAWHAFRRQQANGGDNGTAHATSPR